MPTNWAWLGIHADIFFWNPTMAKRDYYEVLGVRSDASTDEIHERFKRLARETHPDRVLDERERARRTQKFQELSEAHEVLMDPAQRAAYDRALAAGSLWTAAKDRTRASAGRVLGVLREEGEDLARDLGRSSVDRGVDYLFSLFDRAVK